jgi:hypothetical protein
MLVASLPNSHVWYLLNQSRYLHCPIFYRDYARSYQTWKLGIEATEIEQGDTKHENWAMKLPPNMLKLPNMHFGQWRYQTWMLANESIKIEQGDTKHDFCAMKLPNIKIGHWSYRDYARSYQTWKLGIEATEIDQGDTKHDNLVLGFRCKRKGMMMSWHARCRWKCWSQVCRNLIYQCGWWCLRDQCMSMLQLQSTIVLLVIGFCSKLKCMPYDRGVSPECPKVPTRLLSLLTPLPPLLRAREAPRCFTANSLIISTTRS